MSDELPESILLSPEDAVAFGRKYGHSKIGFGPCVGDPFIEYVRKTATMCTVAAAYKDASNAAMDVSIHGPVGIVLLNVQDYIRSRTPKDAKAALEAVKREARNEGMREALAEAKAAATFHEGSYEEYGARYVVCRIEALIEKGSRNE